MSKRSKGKKREQKIEKAERREGKKKMRERGMEVVKEGRSKMMWRSLVLVTVGYLCVSDRSSWLPDRHAESLQQLQQLEAPPPETPPTAAKMTKIRF